MHIFFTRLGQAGLSPLADAHFGSRAALLPSGSHFKRWQGRTNLHPCLPVQGANVPPSLYSHLASKPNHMFLNSFNQTLANTMA